MAGLFALCLLASEHKGQFQTSSEVTPEVANEQLATNPLNLAVIGSEIWHTHNQEKNVEVFIQVLLAFFNSWG